MELKTARKIARLTQRQLAEKVGVDTSLISQIESGRRLQTTSFETVVRMARVFNVLPEELAPVADHIPGTPRPERRAGRDRRGSAAAGDARKQMAAAS